MNFAGLDLNLLRVFDAMMAELNTTRAGERIGLSQPAVSTAIGRLRHVTGDELFVREGNRMVATPRARQLAEPVREALRRVEEALSSVVRFDPATSDQTFRISGSDYFSALLMPRLAAAVVPEAPGVTVQMLDHPGAEAVRLLGEGAIDMGVEADFDLPDWAASHRLFRSFIATVARRDHPALIAAGIRPGERIPPEVYCAVPHVIMSMDGGRTGTVDRVLAERGLARRVAMTVPHFQAVALAAVEAGLLGSLPIHFARRSRNSRAGALPPAARPADPRRHPVLAPPPRRRRGEYLASRAHHSRSRFRPAPDDGSAAAYLVPRGRNGA